MNLAAAVTKKSLIDYYMECGLAAHFLAVAVLIYLWILWVAIGNPRALHRLLMPASLLPILIGVFGSASAYYGGLKSLRFPKNSELTNWVTAWEEGMIPLIVGSFLSIVFVLITLVFQFIHRRTLAGLDDTP